jgi:glycerol-3-phosphate dehydrogenase (NAD(P)+)
LAGAGWRVKLWARRREIAEAIQRDHRNPRYLTTFLLPAAVEGTYDLVEAINEAGLLVLAAPSEGIPDLCRQLADCVHSDRDIVSATKGLEHATGRRLSEVIRQTLGGRLAALSGPNLASEVAAGIATASVAASEDATFARAVQAAFSAPRFRVYTNPDIIGVELGGALKNAIAIGVGMSDGLGFGENTKAALMTRGLAEIERLGITLGAKAETFRGLSGMGDLIATCAGQKSRNHHVGYELAQGRTLAGILNTMAPQVAEGVETTRAAIRLAAAAGVEMPITAAVYATLFEGMTPQDATQSLMSRSWRDELEK